MSKKTDKLNEAALLTDNNKKQQQKLYKTVKAAGGDIGMRVRKDEKTKEDKMPNAIYMDNPWGSSRHIDTYASFQVRESKVTEIEDDQIIEEAGLPTKKGADQFKKFMKKATKGKKKGKKEKGVKDLTGAHISTYESWASAFKDVHNPTRLEDFYMWLDRDKIDLNDDSWVRGTEEDFVRPMFKNLPNHKDRFPYDVLRDGKFLETKDGKIVAQINKLKGKVIVLDIIDEDNKHQYVEFDLVKIVKKIKDKELKINSNEKSKDVKIDTPWGTKFKIKENE